MILFCGQASQHQVKSLCLHTHLYCISVLIDSSKCVCDMCSVLVDQSPNIVSREISLTPFILKCSDRAEIQNIASSLIIPSGVAEPRVSCPPCTYLQGYF